MAHQEGRPHGNQRYYQATQANQHETVRIANELYDGLAPEHQAEIRRLNITAERLIAMRDWQRQQEQQQRQQAPQPLTGRQHRQPNTAQHGQRPQQSNAAQQGRPAQPQAEPRFGMQSTPQSRNPLTRIKQGQAPAAGMQYTLDPRNPFARFQQGQAPAATPAPNRTLSEVASAALAVQPTAQPAPCDASGDQHGKGGNDKKKDGRSMERRQVNRARDIRILQERCRHLLYYQKDMPRSQQEAAQATADRYHEQVEQDEFMTGDVHVVGPVTGTDLTRLIQEARAKGEDVEAASLNWYLTKLAGKEEAKSADKKTVQKPMPAHIPTEFLQSLKSFPIKMYPDSQTLWEKNEALFTAVLASYIGKLQDQLEVAEQQSGISDMTGMATGHTASSLPSPALSRSYAQPTTQISSHHNEGRYGLAKWSLFDGRRDDAAAVQAAQSSGPPQKEEDTMTEAFKRRNGTKYLGAPGIFGPEQYTVHGPGKTSPDQPAKTPPLSPSPPPIEPQPSRRGRRNRFNLGALKASMSQIDSTPKPEIDLSIESPPSKNKGKKGKKSEKEDQENGGDKDA